MSDLTRPAGGDAGDKPGLGKQLRLTLGDKKNRGLLVGAIVLIVLAAVLAFFFYGPPQGKLPSFGPAAPAVVAEPVPAANPGQATLGDVISKVKLSSDQLNQVKTLPTDIPLQDLQPYLEAEFKAGRLTQTEYTVNTALVKMIRDVAKTLTDSNAMQNATNSVMIGTLKVHSDAIVVNTTSLQNVQTRVDAIDKTVQSQTKAINDAAARQQNANPASANLPVTTVSSDSAVSAQNSVSSPNASATNSGVPWKNWTNTTGVTLYARFMGVHWPAGGKPQIVQIDPGKGLVWDGLTINGGDHFVLYDLHNDGKTYTWEQVEANPSLGRYHNIDGSIVRFGYGRAMNVVDNSGYLHSGLAIKQGEGMNVNLESRPPQGKITVAVKTFDGLVVPTLNFEK